MGKSIALVLYGDENSDKNALTDENFKPLADSLIENGFTVESVLFNNSKYDQLRAEMIKYDAVQVWVNPTSGGHDRLDLDLLLSELADKGVYVSTDPEIILKIGTKRVLYTTRDMDWGGDIDLYADYEDFNKRFATSMDNESIRVLKQYRGQSGDGIFKVRLIDTGSSLSVIHATSPENEYILSKSDFYNDFRKYFENGGLLINQAWSQGITNGMVRCYITGTKVGGFGYQEAIALCPYTNEPNSEIRPTSKRFYFSEHCGLFQDLRNIMESKWIPQLQEIHSITNEMMPLLWDVDLFINDVNSQCVETKYTLCEINVSCVSPFPQSCVPHMVRELHTKLTNV